MERPLDDNDKGNERFFMDTGAIGVFCSYCKKRIPLSLNCQEYKEMPIPQNILCSEPKCFERKDDVNDAVLDDIRKSIAYGEYLDK